MEADNAPPTKLGEKKGAEGTRLFRVSFPPARPGNGRTTRTARAKPMFSGVSCCREAYHLPYRAYRLLVDGG